MFPLIKFFPLLQLTFVVYPTHKPMHNPFTISNEWLITEDYATVSSHYHWPLAFSLTEPCLSTVVANYVQSPAINHSVEMRHYGVTGQMHGTWELTNSSTQPQRSSSVTKQFCNWQRPSWSKRLAIACLPLRESSLTFKFIPHCSMSLYHIIKCTGGRTSSQPLCLCKSMGKLWPPQKPFELPFLSFNPLCTRSVLSTADTARCMILLLNGVVCGSLPPFPSSGWSQWCMTHSVAELISTQLGRHVMHTAWHRVEYSWSHTDSPV